MEKGKKINLGFGRKGGREGTKQKSLLPRVDGGSKSGLANCVRPRHSRRSRSGV